MRNKIFYFLATMLLVNVLFAIPAKHSLLSITQQDKRHLDFYLYGDEKLSYAKTLDDYTLIVNNEGYYCYGVLDNNSNLISSNIIATNSEERTVEENNFLRTINKSLSFSQQQIDKQQNAFSTNKSSYPTTGNNNLLIILVSFPDRVCSATQSDFQAIASEHNYSLYGATGSVKDYYYDNSFGQLNLNPIVVGPFMLSHNMAYYGAPSATFSDIRPKEMVAEACHLADSIIDFSQFDMNHDSIIDAVHIIFAGQPQSSTGEVNAIWPHRWFITDTDTVSQRIFDGMKLKDYSCSAEKRGMIIDGIGTICHEFGHVLGLPDYYDTDYAGSGGNATALSYWSIMASGSYNNNGNTPPIFNTNERMRLHWMKVDTLNLANTYSLYPLIDSNKAYILTTDSTNEYFLLENRSKRSWDTYLPNSGMLIYHLKNLGDNCINCKPSFQRCDIVEADNDESNNSLNSDVFTYPTNNHYFTSYDTPNCHLWNGTIIDRPITRIAMDTNTGVVSFRYMIPDTLAIVKTLYGTTQLSSNSFKIKGLSIYDGIGQTLSKGFLVDVNSDFSSAIFYPKDNTIVDTFSTTLSSLNYGQMYYYKAVAINSNNDTVSGDYQTFQTSSGQPYIITNNITNIGLDTIDVTIRKITEGDFPVTEYGIVYDTLINPNINTNKVSFNGDFSTFTATIKNLKQSTLYYFRAYAKTSIGIKYGNTVSAKTKFHPIENDTIYTSDMKKCINETFDSIKASEVSGGLGNFHYLWQEKQIDSSWHNATNTNNLKDYYIGNLTQSTYFRRIAFSENIKDTTNVLFAKVNSSKGGNIFGRDSVMNNEYDTLTLKNNVGDILSWQKNYESSWIDITNSFDQDSIIYKLSNVDSLLIRAVVQNSYCPIVYSDTLKINVKQNVNLNDYIEELSNFYLNPVPANQYVFLNNPKRLNINYSVFNINGQLMTEKIKIIDEKIKINTSSFVQGNYTIKIFNNSTKKTSYLKFVIAR
ncbi:MAG: M6 family metalloprotease domain-containing protein [Bacteroidales bacterium]|jgi:M6 family metalloprotease-like protein|nr:M6 family metalloprotease domain-containing protein [Bacteroidales bacterium]